LPIRSPEGRIVVRDLLKGPVQEKAAGLDGGRTRMIDDLAYVGTSGSARLPETASALSGSVVFLHARAKEGERPSTLRYQMPRRRGSDLAVGESHRQVD
jgi:hypothetical protein